MQDEIRPDYYKHPCGVECKAVTNRLDFNVGNALKYAWRWREKNGLEDLKKARFYLNEAMASGSFEHSEFYQNNQEQCADLVEVLSWEIASPKCNAPLCLTITAIMSGMSSEAVDVILDAIDKIILGASKPVRQP